MKREAKILSEKAFESLVLAIEHFNRPTEKGRTECSLIMLDRAFELLLKAVILQKGGKIREKNSEHTFGLEKCTNICSNVLCPPILNEIECATLKIINKLRDAAQHYFVIVSEQQFYLFCQAGVTIYGKILSIAFGVSISDKLPFRVLPVTTSIPESMEVLISSEFEEIKQLLKPGSRCLLEGQQKLHALEIIEAAVSGEEFTFGKYKSRREIVNEIGLGATWQDLFPGVASLYISSDGSGLAVSLRIDKKTGDKVVLVPEGTPGAQTLAIRKTDKVSYYIHGLRGLAKECGLTQHQLLALVWRHRVQENEDYYCEFRIGSSQHKRYSPNALKFIKTKLESDIIEECVDAYNVMRKK